MACSKYELGYEENRFEIVVSQRFHCPICFLVLKDPVMCKNEHYYCSSCIKKYLENSSFCPTCRESLTVDTLKPASRIVKDYISELNIHCDFHPRGCPEMVQVGHLKRHVANCEFSPVQCSNDGCNVLLNARDKLHHEAEVCDFRKLNCHDCGQLKKEMKDEMKEQIKGTEDKVNGEIKNEVKGIKVMLDQVLVCQDQMQSKIVNEIKQEVKDQIKNEMKNEVRDMKVEIKHEVKELIENEMKEIKAEVKGEIKEEVKRMKDEMKHEMKGMKVEMKGEIKEEVNKVKEELKQEMREIILNAVRDAMSEIQSPKVRIKSSKQDLQATCSSDARENIFVFGGISVYHARIKTAECFNWADQTWTLLDSAMFEGRSYSCSFLYQGQIVVAGGHDDKGDMTNTMKCLNVADPSGTWKDFAVNLPVRCRSHKVVNHNDQLFMSGGSVRDIDGGRFRTSDAVYEVQLVPPYSSKILTRLPQPRFFHGMEMFDQKLFILGGNDGNITASVVQYDIIKNECKEMPPLPYAVIAMATVLWRNNVLVIGGNDAHHNPLNKVAMYDVITGRSQMLPCMKQKRHDCTAVITGNVVVVMGGWNKGYLKSVESFDLERQVWQDLPDMLEPRTLATAVVKPNR